MITKSVENYALTKCSHIYSSECSSCGEDNTYKWIVCARYKIDCPEFICTKCGEIETITERKSK